LGVGGGEGGRFPLREGIGQMKKKRSELLGRLKCRGGEKNNKEEEPRCNKNGLTLVHKAQKRETKKKKKKKKKKKQREKKKMGGGDKEDGGKKQDGAEKGKKQWPRGQAKNHDETGG